MHFAPIPAVLLLATQLTHLAPVDMVILLLYFAMVIFIGFYVKGSTNTSESSSWPGARCRRGSPASASSPPISARWS